MHDEKHSIQRSEPTLQNYHCPKCKYDLTGCDPKSSCPECGTPIMEGCITCEYDLSATELDDNCPECGTPVYCSVGRGALIAVPTEILSSVHTGFRLVTNLILLYIVSLVATFVLAFAVGMNSVQNLYLLTAIAGFINNAIVFGIIIGWFKLSRPLNGLPEMLDVGDKRSFVRVMLWIFAAVTCISLIYSLIPSDPDAPPTIIDMIYGIISLISLFIMLALFIANVMYIGWFAKLVRNKKMSKRAKHFVWSGPLIAIVGFFILFLGPLITLVMYWNMIEYTRRDLKKIIDARAGS